MHCSTNCLTGYGGEYDDVDFVPAVRGVACTVGQGEHNMGTVVLRLEGGTMDDPASRLISTTVLSSYQRTLGGLRRVLSDLADYPQRWGVCRQGDDLSMMGIDGGAVVDGTAVPMLSLHVMSEPLCPLLLAHSVLTRALAAPLTPQNPLVYIHMRVAQRSDLRLQVPGFNCQVPPDIDTHSELTLGLDDLPPP